MKKLRIGILGCGKMGRVHAEWFSRNPCCEVAALYNRTYAKAEALAGLYSGAKVVKNWMKIVTSPDIDVIGICTPSHEHLEQLESSVRAGKHVLCEKPMASSLEESKKMHTVVYPLMNQSNVLSEI